MATPKEKVQALWPEAWCSEIRRDLWEVKRLSRWGVHTFPAAKTPTEAWRKAAEGID